MGNTRHRKGHKNKVNAFKQKAIETKNKTKKLQDMFIQNYMNQQENARKEFMIETIYMNKNELVKEVDGIWQLNDEAVETSNDILVWKVDGNPLLAGLEQLDAYPQYTAELLNSLLPQIQDRLKWRAEKQAAQDAAAQSVEILPISADDFNTFELVEDPTHKEVSDTNEAETQQ